VSLTDLDVVADDQSHSGHDASLLPTTADELARLTYEQLLKAAKWPSSGGYGSGLKFYLVHSSTEKVLSNEIGEEFRGERFAVELERVRVIP
jgi:hypothetical protein